MTKPSLEFDILTTFIESAPVLCLAADRNYNTLFVNAFYRKVHQVTKEQAVGKHIKEIIGEEGFNDNLPYYERTLSGETVKYDGFFNKVDGGVHHYRAIYAPIHHNGDIVGLTGVVLDITSEKLIEQSFEEQRRLNSELIDTKSELESLAASDPLTRLYNRRYFNEVSSRIFNIIQHKSSDLSILMIDIDHFKSINDTHGHKAGDGVIVYMANLLRKQHREEDTVCRFGGEEFIVLLPETTIKQAESIARRLKEAVQHSIVTLDSGKTLKFTVSIGVSKAIPLADESIECSIARADDALYEAKKSGRNRVCTKI